MTDAERLAEFAADLGTKIEYAIPAWVVGSVSTFLSPASRREHAEPLQELTVAVVGSVVPSLRHLLDQDIDQQSSTPLTILRGAVAPMTEFLQNLGVSPVGRDGEARRLHPDDVYDLTPAGFEDFGDDVRQASLMWGAAKAHVHIQRRKSEGMR